MTIAETKTRKRKKNPNGYGCVRKDKTSGRWVASITIGYDSKGKQKFKNFSSKEQKNVIKKLDDFKEKMKSGVRLDYSSITVGEWIDYWYNNYVANRVKIKTRCDYESSVRCHIKPRLGKIKLAELKGLQIQQFYNDLSVNGKLIGKGGGLAPKTIKNVHIALHRALEQAVNNDLIIKNPIKGVTLPKQVSKPIEILSLEEQKKLVDKCFDHPWGMAIFVTLFSGMRLGEVLGLTWKDINFKKNCISINKQASRIQNFEPNVKSKTVLCLRNETKTSSSNRTIAIASQVMEKLQEYKIEQEIHRKKWVDAYNNLNLVFCREDGNLIDPKTFQTFYLKTLKKAEIGHKRFHALRHTFATRALEANANIKVVSQILGHASIQITLDTYSHVSPDLQQDTMQNIADTFL